MMTEIKIPEICVYLIQNIKHKIFQLKYNFKENCDINHQ